MFLHGTHSHYGGDLAWQHGTSSDAHSAQWMQDMLVAGVRGHMTEFTRRREQQDWYEAGFAMGQALHYLQDTYTPSHVERDPLTGEIRVFYDYAQQSPYLHSLGDRPAVDSEEFVLARNVTGSLIKLFLKGDEQAIARFFEVTPDAQTGRAGRYGPRPLWQKAVPSR